MPDRFTALDANCVTYLINGLSSHQGPPTGTNATEETALARCFLYGGPLHASPTAQAQCDDIRDPAKRENHDSWLSTLICPFGLDLDMSGAEPRITELMSVHPDRADCTILVECERYGLDYLITSDAQFLKRLGPQARGVQVCSPSSYWQLLGIEKGSPPRLRPEGSNPMRSVDWWMW